MSLDRCVREADQLLIHPLLIVYCEVAGFTMGTILGSQASCCNA